MDSALDRTVALVVSSRKNAMFDLFCVVDDAYALLNSHARCYECLNRHLSHLSLSEKHAAMPDPYRQAAGLVRAVIAESSGRAGYSGFSLQVDTSALKQSGPLTATVLQAGQN